MQQIEEEKTRKYKLFLEKEKEKEKRFKKIYHFDLNCFFYGLTLKYEYMKYSISSDSIDMESLQVRLIL